jgi:hypothetical protein
MPARPPPVNPIDTVGSIIVHVRNDQESLQEWLKSMYSSARFITTSFVRGNTVNLTFYVFFFLQILHSMLFYEGSVLPFFGPDDHL